MIFGEIFKIVFCLWRMVAYCNEENDFLPEVFYGAARVTIFR
jgi:hypothetical protein